MNQELYIRHLGPIETCTINPAAFTILTGPQSRGKSTVAKAIYFFQTLKQDILTLMLQGGPARSTGEANAKWGKTIQRRMRNKFLELFGTTWIMPEDMCVRYTFRKDVYVEVRLQPDTQQFDKNFVRFRFGQDLWAYLDELDKRVFSGMTPGSRSYEEKQLSELFGDDCETVFIPAGRNLITLLSTQLNYIFTALEESQLRNIDYLTKRYTELILKMRDSFTGGVAGLAARAKSDPELYPGYRRNKAFYDALLKRSWDVLQGEYRSVDGEERLYLDERKYIKINFTSSGQQEVVWVFNLLCYYLAAGKKVRLLIEEPESHLFPESQADIAEMLALFANAGNEVIATTHSPYILGTFNYLLLAGQVGENASDKVNAIVDEKCWLMPSRVSAFFVGDRSFQPALTTEDGCTLIQNSLIDGASERVNDRIDQILELWPETEG